MLSTHCVYSTEIWGPTWEAIENQLPPDYPWIDYVLEHKTFLSPKGKLGIRISHYDGFKYPVVGATYEPNFAFVVLGVFFLVTVPVVLCFLRL